MFHHRKSQTYLDKKIAKIKQQVERRCKNDEKYIEAIHRTYDFDATVYLFR